MNRPPTPHGDAARLKVMASFQWVVSLVRRHSPRTGGEARMDARLRLDLLCLVGTADSKDEMLQASSSQPSSASVVLRIACLSSSRASIPEMCQKCDQYEPFVGAFLRYCGKDVAGSREGEKWRAEKEREMVLCHII